MDIRAGWWRLPLPQRWMIGLLVGAVALASIEAPYPDVAPLHHVPTMLLALAAPWLLTRWPLTSGAVACLFVFLLLHTLGGRYTYSNVPYDAWAEALFGCSVTDAFAFHRNHYDRMVHLAFGLLLLPVLVQLWRRHLRMPRGQGFLFAFEGILAASALYEIFEWLLSLVAAGPLAEDYNGQQGDVWDAQRDMLLAAIGALVSLLTLVVRERVVAPINVP